MNAGGMKLAFILTTAAALQPPHVVVVGGGVGGLATAGRLAKRGARVTVLEKTNRLGGRVGEYSWQNHRWETGASLLLLPDVYRDALDAVGADQLDVKRVQPAYAVWYETLSDRGPVILGGDRSELRRRLELEAPGGFERFEEYRATAREYLRAGWPIFIEEDISPPSLLRLVPRFLATAVSALWKWPLFGHDAQLRRLFPDSPRLRALCSFEDLYVGLTPVEAPAVFSLLAAIELDNVSENPDAGRPDVGVFYPLGGFGQFPQLLADAATASGVDIRTSTAVDEVLVDEGRATGVRTTNGETIDADAVVVNADLAAAEPKLLGSESRSDYANSRYSTSSITFLWALDRRFEELQHHNVFLSEDNDDDDPFLAAWDDQLPPRGASTAFPANGFHFYLCCNSRTDATAAPTDGDSLMVLCPTPPLADADDALVDDWIAKARAAVFERLEKSAGADIAPHVVHERVIDPREWRDGLGLRRGAVFGLAHGLDQLALFRPSRKSSRVDGLSFVGASTRPGNGVPLVLTSARLLCDELSGELGLKDS
jgi:phytoene desaturase (3,4-didehydrolycopene-forming)